MREIISLAPLSFVLAGCASSSSSISASYVSPLQYQSYTCQQLAGEADRLSRRASEVAGAQDEKATGDVVKTTVGIVVFWPLLLFNSGDGQTAAELGRLKGEFASAQTKHDDGFAAV